MGSRIFRLKAEATESRWEATESRCEPTESRAKAEESLPNLVAAAFRRKNDKASGATKSSAFVGFENVAIPSRIAAARSLRGVNNHCVARGDRSGDATSLYSQQKYASIAREKLNTSGMIWTEYTGTTLAMTKAAARIAEGHALDRACRNRHAQTSASAIMIAFNTRNPLVPKSRIKGAAKSG